MARSGLARSRATTPRDNAVLTDISGLSGVTTVGETLSIHTNAALTNLDGLSGVTTVGSLFIQYNAVLTDISGLSGVTTVGGTLSIYSNAALANLDGLSGVTTVDGDLYIWNNPTLCQSLVDAFVATCSCGTVVDISGNNDGC